jgi:hypothetical protein
MQKKEKVNEIFHPAMLDFAHPKFKKKLLLFIMIRDAVYLFNISNTLNPAKKKHNQLVEQQANKIYLNYLPK